MSGRLSDTDKEGKTQFIFFAQRTVAVVMYAETKAEAEAIKKKVIEDTMLEEEYVDWFDGIEGVDRTLMNEDPVEPFRSKDGGAIEEY